MRWPALPNPREPRFVSVEPLNVAPALVGRPLAAPSRRAAAVAIDIAAVTLLANASGYWLALALLLLAVMLRASLVAEGARRLVTAVLIGVVALAACWTAWSTWRTGTSPDEAPPRSTRLAAPPALPASASERERLEQAQAELREARAALKRRTLADHVEATLDEVGASFGWGIVYFSLLPAFWQGQTLGKRLLRLRIVELTGKPITPLRGLKRYGGYAAGMATGGLGFLQVLWEPNRQGLQDKAAHTVVLDERAQGSGRAVD
jgi:hypothetical protein